MLTIESDLLRSLCAVCNCNAKERAFAVLQRALYRALQMQNGPSLNKNAIMVTMHILQTDFGVTAELEPNEETGDFKCVWDGVAKHPSEAQREKILGVYIPWRDELIEDWAKRTGKIVRIINL